LNFPNLSNRLVGINRVAERRFDADWIHTPIWACGIIYGRRRTDYVGFVDLCPTSANIVGFSNGAGLEGVAIAYTLVVSQNALALTLIRVLAVWSMGGVGREDHWIVSKTRGRPARGGLSCSDRWSDDGLM
jgi:hypothetical protein